MKVDEFKAWFEGFTEAMKGVPTKDQWERIKARVAEVDGTQITQQVYIDRYLRPYRDYWLDKYYCGGLSIGGVTTNSTLTAEQNFSSVSAMSALGKEEYSMTA